MWPKSIFVSVKFLLTHSVYCLCYTCVIYGGVEDLTTFVLGPRSAHIGLSFYHSCMSNPCFLKAMFKYLKKTLHCKVTLIIFLFSCFFPWKLCVRVKQKTRDFKIIAWLGFHVLSSYISDVNESQYEYYNFKTFYESLVPFVCRIIIIRFNMF